MKKKLLKSMRVLLVAAGLCAGANAWGDPITNVNLTFDGTATFTNSAAISYTAGTGEVFSSLSGTVWANSSNTVGGAIENDTKLLRLSNGNITVALNGDAAGNKDIVTIEFDLAYGGAYTSSAYLNTFTIKDIEGNAIVTESYKTGTNTDNKISSSTMGVTQDYIYVKGGSTDFTKAVHFAFTFNYETQKISLTTTCSSATQTSGNFQIDMPAGTKAVGSFYLSNAKTYPDRGLLFDNLVIQTTVGDYSSSKTITYAYEDEEGNDISELLLANGGIAAASPNVNETYTPTYPTTVTSDDYTTDFTYTSGGDAFTVTDDATITLVYTKSAHPTTSVTLQRKTGDDLISSTVMSESYLVGKPITYPVNEYVLYQGKLYSTPAVGDPYYKKTVAAAATLIDSYTATSIENVVYYSEAEDITGMSTSETGNIPRRLSCGKGGYSTENDIVLTSLPAGAYKLTTVIYKNNSGSMTVDFVYGDGDDDKLTFTQSGSTNGSTYSGEFTITETADIKLKAGTSAVNCLDFIFIQKTSETVNFTLGADAGESYKSYVTTTATDFAATGVIAYIATKANTTAGTVTLTTIDQAPANTPVLLKGTKGGTAEIATTTDDVAAIGTNYLVAANGSTSIGASDAKYVLAYNDKWEFRHYNGTLSAGKVYLDLSALGARATTFNFVFDDVAAGISTVQGETNDANGFYNLNGQRVNQAAKGLYIMNGKKVIIK